MAYLGVETVAARELVAELRHSAGELDEVQRLLAEAETLSDIGSQAMLLLDQVRADWLRSASAIAAALATVESFRLHLPGFLSRSSVTVPVPVRTPVPSQSAVNEQQRVAAASAPARWDASLSTAWNDVHQDASHNSYAVPGGVAALFDLGVRTFELDIHRGPPATLLPAMPWTPVSSSPHAIDWQVYHMTGDSESEYEFLSDGLNAVAALDTTEPLTIFVDNKDSFDGSHTAEQLDRVLEASLGDRLYRPADLSARAPGAATMHAVIDGTGWPTVHELDGRIMVVLTGNVGDYEPDGPAAFVAGSPNLVRSAEGIEHVAISDRIFYNANFRRLDEDGIEAMYASGGALRTYFNPLCNLTPLGEEPASPNYRAVDVEPGSPSCGPGVYVPPVDTPVPEPDAG